MPIPKLAALICASLYLAASGVAAATIQNVAGVYDESWNNVSEGPASAVQLRDFNETAGDPTLEIMGNTHIFGFVAHRRGGTAPRYTDKWKMAFGSTSYTAVFRWTGLSRDFDGRLLVNDVQELLNYRGEINLGVLSGDVDFTLDPIFGRFGPDPDETAKWELEVIAVPTPASAFLLMAGIVGLAALGRRRKH